MKNMIVFNSNGGNVERLGIKFASPYNCMCDHDVCATKCGCSNREFAECAWSGSGKVDGAVQAVTQE